MCGIGKAAMPFGCSALLRSLSHSLRSCSLRSGSSCVLHAPSFITSSLRFITPYYRNGKLQGIEVLGKKFRLSRLGLNELHLENFDPVKNTQTMQLTGLNELRNKRDKEITKNNSRPAKENDDVIHLSKDEQSQLNELSIIRNRRSQQRERNENCEILQRDFNISETQNLEGETISRFATFRNVIKPVILEKE